MAVDLVRVRVYPARVQLIVDPDTVAEQDEVEIAVSVGKTT